MARLHEDSDSDEEFPHLSTIMGLPRKTGQRQPPSSAATCGQEQRKEAPNRAISGPKDGSRALASKGAARVSCDEKQVKKQGPLKIAHVNTLLLPIPSGPTPETKRVEKISDDSDSEEPVRPTPRRVAKKQIDYDAFTSALSTALDSDDDQSFHDLSDFIVRDSDSELEVRSLKSPKKSIRRSPKKSSYDPDATRSSTNGTSQSEVIDLISPDETDRGTKYPKAKPRLDNAPPDTQANGVSSTEEPPATLRL